MSGIIEGYNYDIFISYRQKDNKGDRWVSEFVDNLGKSVTFANFGFHKLTIHTRS